MGFREDVADAVNAAGITGVHGVPASPVVRMPGAAWAQWESTVIQQMLRGIAWRDQWTVFLLLPSETPEITADSSDAWRGPLLTALYPLGEIGEVLPAQVFVDEGASVPAISIQILQKGM